MLSSRCFLCCDIACIPSVRNVIYAMIYSVNGSFFLKKGLPKRSDLCNSAGLYSGTDCDTPAALRDSDVYFVINITGINVRFYYKHQTM